MANTGPTQNSAGQSPAANGMAIVRVTIGAMLVSLAGRVEGGDGFGRESRRNGRSDAGRD
jgi:hypothetical protein